MTNHKTTTKEHAHGITVQVSKTPEATQITTHATGITLALWRSKTPSTMAIVTIRNTATVKKEHQYDKELNKTRVTLEIIDEDNRYTCVTYHLAGNVPQEVTK